MREWWHSREFSQVHALNRALEHDALICFQNSPLKPFITKKIKNCIHFLLQERRSRLIYDFTQKTARRWGVRLYRYANVGNHIHLLIKVPSRAVWQRFLRELSGGIAILVTGARKGEALEKNSNDRGFWDHLAFSRIVYFGKDFETMGRYLVKNLFESMGIPMRLLMLGYRVCSVSKDGVLSGAPPG